MTYVTPPDVLEDFSLAPTQQVRASGTINNFATTADQPPALILFNPSAALTLTGMVPPGPWTLRRIKVMSSASASLTIANQSASSDAANRFSAASDITVAAGEVLSVLYDPVIARWIPIGAPYGPGTVPSAGSGRVIGTPTLITVGGALVPPAGAAYCSAILQGGGGGAGSAQGDPSPGILSDAITAGGNAGGTLYAFFPVQDASYTVTIGAAGAGGTAAAQNGGDGTDTTIVGATLGTLTAQGGNGSAASLSAAGLLAIANTPTTGGLYSLNGSRGSAGIYTFLYSAPDLYTVAVAPGAGGDSPFGTGGATDVNGAASDGTGYGAGGSGVTDATGVVVAGGDGSPGCVLVTWYS